MLATCYRPERRGRGVESDQVALKRGRIDAVIAGMLFMAGMRRSEVSALCWADVVESTDGDGMLVTVRRSKTNQEGETNDVRYVKDGVARARATRTGGRPPPRGRAAVATAQLLPSARNRQKLDSGRPQDVVVAGGIVKPTACACAHRRQGASLRSAPAPRG